MEPVAATKPWAVFLGVLACFLFVSALGFDAPPLFLPQGKSQPLHADEAVQWSLAMDAAAGTPYSVNEDKFHGPALAVATRAVFALRGLGFEQAEVDDEHGAQQNRQRHDVDALDDCEGPHRLLDRIAERHGLAPIEEAVGEEVREKH